MPFIRTVLVGAVMLAAATAARAEDAVLRIAVLEFGTVNWELDTIRHHGLDTSEGFALDVQGMAGGPATQVAFQGGEVDAMVSDFIWVARQMRCAAPKTQF